jgi:hypothetical protein
MDALGISVSANEKRERGSRESADQAGTARRDPAE